MISIFNRDFQHPDDGWYQIEVPGEHRNNGAGVIQVIDDKSVASQVSIFNREADAAGPNYPGMLIDIEHFRHDSSKETRAYGWLMRLRNKNGVPEGQIRWTGTGRQAVDNGDYRFFSTEYDLNEADDLGRQGDFRKVRPLRLDGLTLTNDPNNKGGRPITNRENMSDTPKMNGSQAARLSAAAYKASDSADSMTANEDAAVLHRKAAAAQREAHGDDSLVAAHHDECAENHDAIAEKMRGNDAQNREVVNNRAPGDYGAPSPLLNREVASAELRRLAEVHRGQTGASFGESYNLIRQTRPDLMEAANAPVVVEIPDNAATRQVAREIALSRRLANRRLVQVEITREMQDERRDAIAGYQRDNNVSYAEAHGAIRNRRPDLFGFVSEEIEDIAPEPETAGSAHNRRRAVEEYQALNRCSYEQAQNAVRERRPELFGLVLNRRAEAEEDAPPEIKPVVRNYTQFSRPARNPFRRR